MEIMLEIKVLKGEGEEDRRKRSEKEVTEVAATSRKMKIKMRI